MVCSDASAVQVGKGFLEDLLQKLRLLLNGHGAVFNPGDRQEVFHQVDQPRGVVIDGGVEGLLFPSVRTPPFSIRMPALPLMLVSGVRRSWGDGPSRLARRASCLAASSIFA